MPKPNPNPNPNPNQDFTKWRVHPADVQRVPAEDCPEAWGRREDWFAQVRV